MWVEHTPQTKWGLSRNYCHELQAPWFLLEEKKDLSIFQVFHFLSLPPIPPPPPIGYCHTKWNYYEFGPFKFTLHQRLYDICWHYSEPRL